MAIYEITKDQIRTVAETSFGKAGVRERGDLQRLLREQIQIVSPDTLVIAEEFGEWEDSRRRIDLLGLDKTGNLVVIELKRTDDGGHMELQALRYAAMISTMTFDKVVDAYAAYLEKMGREGDARSLVLDFLEWDEPNDDEFAQDTSVSFSCRRNFQKKSPALSCGSMTMDSISGVFDSNRIASTAGPLSTSNRLCHFQRPVVTKCSCARKNRKSAKVDQKNGMSHPSWLKSNERPV